MHSSMWVIITLTSFALLSSANYLTDPISLEKPPFEVITHTFKPTIPVTQQGPIQTNKFYGNFLTSENGDPVHVHPYVVRMQKINGPSGLVVICDFKNKLLQTSPVRIDLETIYGSKEFYMNTLNNDMIFSAVEINPYTQSSVTYHDALGCHLQMGSAGSKITFPIFRGMAFVTGEYENMTPSFYTISFFKSINGVAAGVVTGNRFRIEIANGQIWMLYADKTISLKYDVNNIRSTALFTGVLRLARIPNDDGAEAIFDAYRSKYVIGGSVDFAMTGQYSANYIINWKTNGNGDLLHFALPHHVDTFVNGVKTNLKLWSTVKGELIAYVGSTWTFAENGLTDIRFLPKNRPDSALVPEIIAQIIKDINEFQIYPSTVSASNYFGGKGLAKLMLLCLIANDLNVPSDTYQKCISMAYQGITPYIQNQQMNSFRYDRIWGGIIGNNGLNCTNLDIICSGMDFGASYYNDHHYHYGYLIHAAAVLTKLDPSFGVKNKVWVENLIRDVANPSTLDPYFPVYRSFDWYTGHSYSQGIFSSADGKDEESTSEEINFHYAMMLWGTVTGSLRFENMGNIMLALNKRIIQKYFLMKSDNIIHPPTIIKNKVAGITFENKVHYTTWFGFNFEYIHGIQMIPEIPVTNLVRSYEFISEEWESRLKNLNLPDTSAWKSLLYLSYATVNKIESWNVLKRVAVDDGLTRAWALYSIACKSGPSNQVPAPTIFNTAYLNFVIGAFNDWDFSKYNAYLHKATSSLSAITIKNSITTANDYYSVAAFTKLSNQSQFGVVSNLKETTNGKQFAYVKYSNDGNLYFCLEYYNLNLRTCSVVNRPTWNIGQRKVIKLRSTIMSTNLYFTVYLDSTQLASYSVPTSWGNGDHGILADKDIIFDNVFVSSPTNIKVTLTDCSLSDSAIITSIASAMGVSPLSILGLQRLGCSKKKTIEAAETISFNIVGTTDTSSSSLAYKLQSNPPENFESIIYSTQTIDTIADLAGVTPIALSLVVPAGGLSLVAIASIIASAGVVVAGIIAGIVLYFRSKTKIKKPTISAIDEIKSEKRNNDNDRNTTTLSETELQSPITPRLLKRPKSAIDVINLDSNNRTSITARTHKY